MGLTISDPNFKSTMEDSQIEHVKRTFVSGGSIEDNFNLQHEIGAGAFGRVIFARDKEMDTPVAIKIMEKKNNPFSYREVELIHSVSHPNVCDCKAVYEDNDNIYLVTTAYTGGELYDYVADNLGEIEPRRAFELGMDMLRALEACHMSGFAHLDVKPENFMFKTKALGAPLVLVDFGSAEPFVRRAYADTSDKYDPEGDDKITDLERLTGTAMYMSPEVSLAAKFSSRSDVWSVGVTLFIMLTGSLPYESDEDKKTPLFETLDTENQIIKKILSAEARTLLNSMLHLDASQRVSTSEAIATMAAILESGLSNEHEWRDTLSCLSVRSACVGSNIYS